MLMGNGRHEVMNISPNVYIWGIPIDRRSDRPIIEKGPIDRYWKGSY